MEAGSPSGVLILGWFGRLGDVGGVRGEELGVKLGTAGYGSVGRLVTIGASAGLVLVGGHSLAVNV